MMRAPFTSSTSLAYIFLCCINATLLLLILLQVTSNPAPVLQPGDHHHHHRAVAVHNILNRRKGLAAAAAAGVVHSIEQVDPKQTHDGIQLRPTSCRSFITKMASSFMANYINLPPRSYPVHHRRALHHADINHAGAGAMTVGTHDEFRLSEFVSTARRSLLHLADVAGHHEEVHSALVSTTKVTLDAHGATAKTSAVHIPQKHLPHHEMDVSANFHVDYSGPKTHPPKNN